MSSPPRVLSPGSPAAPGGDSDPPTLEARSEDLALEQPQAVGASLDLGSALLDERDRIDHDDSDVEAPSAKVLERSDESQVDERCERQHERGRRAGLGRG